MGFLPDPLYRWFSTNTRTLDFGDTKSETSAGMSYRGKKTTTFNGIECLPWGEVFSRCTKGFEEQNRKLLSAKAQQPGEDYAQLELSSYLSHMSPDRLGLRSKTTPAGLFESDTDTTTLGHNECRIPGLYRRCSHKSRTDTSVAHPRLLATTGPFCFVNASDPRAVNFISTTGINFTTATR